MSITVGDIYTAFPAFKPKDMLKLVGKEEFNGRTVIPLERIAAYKNKDLSIFVAKEEKNSYTKLLGDDQTKVNKEAGIKEQPKNVTADNNNAQPIPMETSIFDIAQKEKYIA